MERTLKTDKRKKVSYFKIVARKRKIKKTKYQKHKKLNRKQVLKNYLKSENKGLQYQLEEKLENLKEQAARLQKCIAENGALRKSFVLQGNN